LRTYEALYIITPEMDDDAVQTVAGEVDNLITANGGAIVRSEIWGRRKLAYEVKKHSEGNYVLIRFEAEPDFVAKLESFYKLSDAIIRYLVTQFDARTLKLEAEQIRRREEEIKAGAHRGHDDDDGDDDDDDDDDRRRRGRGRRYNDDDDDYDRDDD